MKKHTPLFLTRMTLCLLPVLFLSPLLFGAGQKNCGYVPFNGACNYAGCDLTIYSCSDYDYSPNCETNGKARQIAVDNFSCTATVPPDNTKACDPVLNGNGTAATKDCIIKYSCILDPDFGWCLPGTKTGSCTAPYYQQ